MMLKPRGLGPGEAVLSSSSCLFFRTPNFMLSQAETTSPRYSLPKYNERVQAFGEQTPEAGIMLCSITVVVFSLL